MTDNKGFSVSEKEVLYTVLDYTAVHLPFATFQPYVAAWKYNFSDNTWAQGHYFSNKQDMDNFIIRKVG